MKVNNMHEFVKKNNQCCFCWLGFFFFVIFYFSMLEQQCPAQVLWRKTKTDEVEVWTRVLLSTEHSCCVTMKMMSKEQLTLSLSLLPEHWFYPPWLSRTQTAYELFSHLPSSPAWTPTEARMDTVLSQGTSGLTVLSVKTYPREKHLVCLFVCLSDRSTTLPQLHSQRLQWEITFLVNLIFFLSGLTFH